jgi:hypothetical protein
MTKVKLILKAKNIQQIILMKKSLELIVIWLRLLQS